MIGDASDRRRTGAPPRDREAARRQHAHVTRGVEEALAAMQPGLDWRDDRLVDLPAGHVHRGGRGEHRPDVAARRSSCVAAVVAAFMLQWRAVVIASSRPRCRWSPRRSCLHVLRRDRQRDGHRRAGGRVGRRPRRRDRSTSTTPSAASASPRPDGSSPSSADILAASVMEVRGSVVFATVIILLVLVPVLVIEGVIGSFLRPFALAFALAVVASMVVGADR